MSPVRANAVVYMGHVTYLLDVTKQQTCMSSPYSTQDSMG